MSCFFASHRGQRYFKDNQLSLMATKMFGLLSVLAEPKTGRILNSTGKSSTPGRARGRLVSTLFHTLSWYQHELTPSSKSWCSLTLVRKMHFLASEQATRKGFGLISQLDLCLTGFGFMGYAITRPTVLGIDINSKDNSVKQRDGYIHFWAVIFSLLGIRDEFNFCLHPLPVVEKICNALEQYIFRKVLHRNSNVFDFLTRTFFEGQAKFFPVMSYDTMMFLLKRTAGLDGYLYRFGTYLNPEDVKLFTIDEMKQIKEQCDPDNDYFNVSNEKFESFGRRRDERYYQLHWIDRLQVKTIVLVFENYMNPLMHVVIDWLIDKILKNMDSYMEERRQLK